MPAETRDRLIEAAARLFWRQGYNGTGIKQIVAEVGVPFASLYHFFPTGKEELASEAIRWSGQQYALLVGEVLASQNDPAEAMRVAFHTAAAHISGTHYADACPIATVALEASDTSEPIRLACAETFESWLTALATWFTARGVPAGSARPLALTFVMLLEGAFVLARTSRDVAPLDVAGEQMSQLVEAALLGGRRPARGGKVAPDAHNGASRAR